MILLQVKLIMSLENKQCQTQASIMKIYCVEFLTFQKILSSTDSNQLMR